MTGPTIFIIPAFKLSKSLFHDPFLCSPNSLYSTSLLIHCSLILIFKSFLSAINYALAIAIIIITIITITIAIAVTVFLSSFEISATFRWITTHLTFLKRITTIPHCSHYTPMLPTNAAKPN